VIGKRPISVATILALLATLVLPAQGSVHHCAGSDAVQKSLAARDALDEHDACDHGGCHREAVIDNDHHEQQAGTHERMTTGDFGYSFCCAEDALAPHQSLDLATLSGNTVQIPVISVLTLLVLFAPAVDGNTLSMPGYKIGSSPPYLASISRHTYIRTSVLLI
jgi:hypothetical protein